MTRPSRLALAEGRLAAARQSLERAERAAAGLPLLVEVPGAVHRVRPREHDAVVAAERAVIDAEFHLERERAAVELARSRATSRYTAIHRLETSSTSSLEPGDPVPLGTWSDDELERLVAEGLVLLDERFPAPAPARFYVAAGRSVGTLRGILPPGSPLRPEDLPVARCLQLVTTGHLVDRRGVEPYPDSHLDPDDPGPLAA
jgi:hypothetical protein